LKNKIILISKELDLVSKEKVSLKNDFDALVCHVSIASSSIDKHFACSTSSSIKNDICVLKKNVDCLGFTLSQCVMNYTKLEFMFRKKHAPHMHAPVHDIHMLLMFTYMTPCMIECTFVYIVIVRATLQNFVMIG